MQWGNTRLTDISLRDCINLKKIASPSVNSFKDVKDFCGTFRNCRSLTSIPKNLFANCTNAEYFQNAFANCSNIQGNVPRLWLLGTNTPENSYRGNPDGGDCFANCTKITGYSAIPRYWITYAEPQ